MRPEIKHVRTAGRGGLSRSFVLGLVALTLVLTSVLGAAASLADEPVFARLETGAGNIMLVFYPDLAPNHVGNFVHLSKTGFYDGSKFHRIVPGFVIQGGDPNSKDADPRNDGLGGPSMSDVLTEDEMKLVATVNDLLMAKGYAGLDGPANLKAEFTAEVKHVRGSLSMARSQSVDSAGSQFFICVAATPQLDGKYTIFGQVVTGIEVADAIVSAPKNTAAGRDAPQDPVAINKVTIFEGVAEMTDLEKTAWDEMPADLKTGK
jgi:cyclophilin family peptidyl-prolyl cis-trans isomerase